MTNNAHNAQPSGDGLERDSVTQGGVNPLASTHALLLLEDASVAALLHTHLAVLGVESSDARSLAGAAALLQRDESFGTPADFLFADEKIAGTCGKSMCGALMLKLRHRPTVLLATQGERAGSCEDVAGSCVDAMFDFRTSAAELGVLLRQLRKSSL
jgi:hypothetical protein